MSTIFGSGARVQSGMALRAGNLRQFAKSWPVNATEERGMRTHAIIDHLPYRASPAARRPSLRRGPVNRHQMWQTGSIERQRQPIIFRAQAA